MSRRHVLMLLVLAALGASSFMFIELAGTGALRRNGRAAARPLRRRADSLSR
jgi:hypothetical protein